MNTSIIKTPDARKSARRRLHYPGWIDLGDGSAPHECILWDVSTTGAKLTLPKELAIPETFHLILSRSGNPKRHCQLVWRDNLSAGIKFLRGAPSIVPPLVALDC